MYTKICIPYMYGIDKIYKMNVYSFITKFIEAFLKLISQAIFFLLFCLFI